MEAALVTGKNELELVEIPASVPSEDRAAFLGKS